MRLTANDCLASLLVRSGKCLIFLATHNLPEFNSIIAGTNIAILRNKPCWLVPGDRLQLSVYKEDRIMRNLQSSPSFIAFTRDSSLVDRIILLFVACVLPVLVLVSTNCFASDSCVTADCHAGMGKAEFVHEPVDGAECDMCHAETGKPHPGEGGAFELTEQGPALCFQCHDDPGEGKKLIHPPVEEDCTNCHNPHQGTQPRFLHKPLGDLCLSCHDQIREIIQSAKSKHDPVARGQCLTCHRPHASDHLTLFISDYPRNSYTPYSDKKFALCFQCHRKEAFTLERTAALTNFRNVNQNLHYLHVNRSEGRVCVNCHGVHGADQPKLIHSESPAFGVWNIPVIIKMTKTGATCVAGCHKQKSYDRFTEVVNR